MKSSPAGMPGGGFYVPLATDNGFLLFWKPIKIKANGQMLTLDYTTFTDVNYKLQPKDSVVMRFTLTGTSRPMEISMDSIGWKTADGSLKPADCTTMFSRPKGNLWEMRFEGRFAPTEFLTQFLSVETLLPFRLGNQKFTENRKHLNMRKTMRELWVL